MNVATALGVGSTSAPAIRQARERWEEWIRVEPDLDIGLQVDDLPAWTWRRDPRTDDVLRALARLSSPHGHDDPLATTVLAWLLVPGASSIARQVRDRTSAAHELTAGALWVACREVDPERQAPIAARVLRTTRRAVQAELGLGEGGRRADRAWSATSTWSPQWGGWEAVVAPSPITQTCAADELLDLLQDATAAGVITPADGRMLLDIALITDQVECTSGVGSRREACGLGNRAAASAISLRLGVSERTVRRRLRRCIDQLTEYSVTSYLASA
ncbi:hypothetical protein [Aeromicrobium sp. Sec7.5]|uniref:hypothetical protein n=1 Tax=Aeromicrobium sp. Sec7.5 TaxID=3121276 RepID=UPI002FE48221